MLTSRETEAVSLSWAESSVVCLSWAWDSWGSFIQCQQEIRHLWNGTHYLPKLARVAEGPQSWEGGTRVRVPSTRVFFLYQGSCCIYTLYCSLRTHVMKDGSQWIELLGGAVSSKAPSCLCLLPMSVHHAPPCPHLIAGPKIIFEITGLTNFLSPFEVMVSIQN